MHQHRPKLRVRGSSEAAQLHIPLQKTGVQKKRKKKIKNMNATEQGWNPGLEKSQPVEGSSDDPQLS